MIKYFRKRKNFNRIKKLIKTKGIKRFTTFVGFLGINGAPLRTAYSINDTIYIYCDIHSKYRNSYLIKENGKELKMDWCDISELYCDAVAEFCFRNR